MISNPEHAQVIAALAKIEQAQIALYAASRELCSVEGYAPQCRKAAVLGDKATMAWHDLNGRLELDLLPTLPGPDPSEDHSHDLDAARERKEYREDCRADRVSYPRRDDPGSPCYHR